MIGERLEEARKRMNLSIREVAEATKIRGDYLIAMEDNSFDIPLPQIYIRGFLKNYTRFLKLDPSRILTDYDAHLLGHSDPDHGSPSRPASGSHASDRESLGSVRIPDAPEKEQSTPKMPDEDPVVVTEAPEDEGPEPELRFSLDRESPSAATSSPAKPTAPPPTLDREGTRHDQEDWNENKTLYMKIGVVFAGILLVSIILIVLIRLISGGEETPELNPDLAREVPVESTSPDPVPTGEIVEDTLIISASDNVTLIIEQTIDNRRLYSGSLNAGETLSLDKEGPVSIRFTNGSALLLEKDGRQFRPGQSGVGRTVVE